MRAIATVTPGEVSRRLLEGAVAVLPTETVYGLAATPAIASAVRRIFELKGRPPEFNLPVLIGGIAQLPDLGVDFNDTARRLADRFWPGPLTMVMGFGGDRERPDWLRERPEVAIRFPAFPFLTDVAALAGPLLLTSANGHGDGAKRTAREAVASLHGAADLVVDGGTLSTVPSTIVNTRHSPARVERVGAIALPDLQGCVGRDRIVVETP
jgi:L-threonylcarbamoyladenylate synthase